MIDGLYNSGKGILIDVRLLQDGTDVPLGRSFLCMGTTALPLDSGEDRYGGCPGSRMKS